MNDAFSGFPPGGLAFLGELPSHDKLWFRANRATWDEEIMAPARAFVTALGEQLQAGISPAIVASPKVNGSIAPINRDVRFSADKAPYKDHLLFRWWEGPDKKMAPTLYVRLSAADVGFATGAMFDVGRWRALIDDDRTGRPLADAIAEIGRMKPVDVAGAELKRVPAPYPADHPRGDLLRHKWIQLRWSEALPASVGSARFVGWCMSRLRLTADIHRWLVANLQASL